MSKKEFERKLREEQEATAHAFQEFIQTFQDTTGPPNKMFVKSGILNVKTGQEIESEKGLIYNPQPFFKQTVSNTIKNAIECARLLKENKITRVKGQEKPKSNLELLKEELKLRHMVRGERNKIKEESSLHPTLDSVGSTDPNTTNLFIANINPKITEQDLMQLFGAYGPLASVKIMWPRYDAKNKTTNCGFVAFMSRRDGERAMQNLKDRDDMRVDWGKPVELPANPIYIPPELLKLFLPPPYTGLPFNAQPLKQPFKYPTDEKSMEELLYNSVIKVAIPMDKKVLMTVHRMIEFVIREGPLFEAMIMNQEINNPTYQFLFDNKSSVHIYYRWKLYTLLHGNNHKNWSTEKFRMFENGSVWCPPITPNYTKGMPDHLIDDPPGRVDKSMLSDAQKTRFIQLIQTLNLTKKKIGEAMVFCLNHADAVKDVVEIIIDSFMNDSTKPPKKVARLYLLSDVLYNSSMKKCYAPIYHTEFEKNLMNIFCKLHVTYASLSCSYDKQMYKSKVLNVLRLWDLWKIYPNEFLNALENRFLGVNKGTEDEDDFDGPLDGANLIKRSIRNRVECAAREEMKEKSKTATPKQDPPLLPGFIPSKWETVDPEEVEAQAMSTKKFYDLELERKQEEKKATERVNAIENKQEFDAEREMLRKVELMVVQCQVEYESGKRKLKRGRSLEGELNNYRKQLFKEMKKVGDISKHKRKLGRASSESSDEEESDYKRKRGKTRGSNKENQKLQKRRRKS